ncbi:NUDIX domain-containing protein [Thioalbus denitrificans]|uniref:NUDIX domain-containing protein n=1 Tax=Thioalbus denitrificans TaxID=547122 RepID=A0A369CFB7_9GAMM|nr:NUDIX domain-containing protein [Thioalbus denitrificans]RCX31247.1 NUDIX domain-containing protein [Thioalbus denitrificans]
MGPVHILSAGVVVVRRWPDGWRFLLLRAWGNWDFPKGEVEAGEVPLAAARREVAEETGLTELGFRWGEGWFETAPYGRGKVARYYLAEARQGEVTLPLNPGLGRAEHHEYRWVAGDAAGQLLPARLQPALEWARATLRREGGTESTPVHEPDS